MLQYDDVLEVVYDPLLPPYHWLLRKKPIRLVDRALDYLLRVGEQCLPAGILNTSPWDVEMFYRDLYADARASHLFYEYLGKVDTGHSQIDIDNKVVVLRVKQHVAKAAAADQAPVQKAEPPDLKTTLKNAPTFSPEELVAAAQAQGWTRKRSQPPRFGRLVEATPPGACYHCWGTGPGCPDGCYRPPAVKRLPDDYTAADWDRDQRTYASFDGPKAPSFLTALEVPVAQ